MLFQVYIRKFYLKVSIRTPQFECVYSRECSDALHHEQIPGRSYTTRLASFCEWLRNQWPFLFEIFQFFNIHFHDKQIVRRIGLLKRHNGYRGISMLICSTALLIDTRSIRVAYRTSFGQGLRQIESSSLNREHFGWKFSMRTAVLFSDTLRKVIFLAVHLVFSQ